MAQLGKHLTSAQVMISRFMSSNLVLGSVLTAQSLEPALDSVSHSLSLPLPHCLSLSLKNKYTLKKKKKKSLTKKVSPRRKRKGQFQENLKG